MYKLRTKDSIKEITNSYYVDNKISKVDYIESWNTFFQPLGAQYLVHSAYTNSNPYTFMSRSTTANLIKTAKISQSSHKIIFA